MSKRDDLLAEVAKRRATGREITLDQNPTNADIEAALELDNQDAAAHTPDMASGLPEGNRNNIPDIPLYATMPADSEYKGRYKNKRDGEDYAMVVVADDPEGKTHKLKNTAHFWEGSEEEFLATFKQ